MKHLTEFSEQIDELAFVPTMGALHDGHLALIRKACEFGKKVLVSVYVNPTQFESADDLAKYPKTLERDLELAHSAGADYLWTPSVQEIYPEGLASVQLIPAGPLGDLYEGASRPQHFSGVLTVINRLFTITNPRFAIFGEKDFQQLFLITKMAAELHPDIEIVPAPTIREISGLAMSSRNVRLSTQARTAADVIAQVLRKASENEDTSIARTALEEISREPLFTLDYAEIIDEETFELASEETEKRRAIIAGWIDGVRLIDNMAMKSALVRA